MTTAIKKIDFENVMGYHDHFDLIDLQEILRKNPKDHSQYEHHEISFYMLVFITNKKGAHSINYEDYTFKKGTVLTLRKNNIHKFYKSNAQGKLLVFTEDFVLRYSDKIETLKLFQLFNEMLASPRLQLNSNDFVEIESIIHQMEIEYLKVKDDHSIEIIRSLMQVLILRLFRIKAKENLNLEYKNYHLKFLSLQKLVEMHCFKSKKVSFYANKMGVTTRTLNNITQNVINKHAKLFIDEIVILQIKRLLINSNYSFTEISYQAGFNEPTNFFKFFRKQVGLSPKQFTESIK